MPPSETIQDWIGLGLKVSDLRLLLHSRGEKITITASSCRHSRVAMSDFLVNSNTEDAPHCSRVGSQVQGLWYLNLCAIMKDSIILQPIFQVLKIPTQ